MRPNETVLDFTSPGALPPDSSNLIRQITTETETTIRMLEQALETGSMKAHGWQLLASFYLATNRINDFNALKSRYEVFFNEPIFTELYQGRQLQLSHCIVFEIPHKIITNESLPEIVTVIKACNSPGGVLLDCSRVRGANIAGLKALAKFFSQLPRDITKPKIRGFDSFIINLEKSADSDSGVKEMWYTLFEYYRFCGDINAFDDLAIRYAVHFAISPPSW